MKKIILILLLTIGISFPSFANDRTYVFLKTVLDNMVEDWQHSIGVEIGRHVVYVDKEGKREAVYDRQNNGILVTDATNMGTYNYYPHWMGAEHFAQDAYPWLVQGNGKGDRSTAEQRWSGWGNDFMMSFKGICLENPTAFDAQKSSFSAEPKYNAFIEMIFNPLLNDDELDMIFNGSNICRLWEKNSRQDFEILAKKLRQIFLPENLAQEKYLNAYKNLPEPKEIKEEKLK